MMNLKPATGPKPSENVWLHKLRQIIIARSTNSWKKATIHQVGPKTIQILHLNLLGQTKVTISQNPYSRITSLLGQKIILILVMLLHGQKILLKTKRIQQIINLPGWRTILPIHRIIRITLPLHLGWNQTVQIRFKQILGRINKQQRFNAKRKSFKKKSKEKKSKRKKEKDLKTKEKREKHNKTIWRESLNAWIENSSYQWFAKNLIRKNKKEKKGRESRKNWG